MFHAKTGFELLARGFTENEAPREGNAIWWSAPYTRIDLASRSTHGFAKQGTDVVRAVTSTSRRRLGRAAVLKY